MKAIQSTAATAIVWGLAEVERSSYESIRVDEVQCDRNPYHGIIHGKEKGNLESWICVLLDGHVEPDSG